MPKKQQHDTDNDFGTDSKPTLVSEENEITNNNNEEMNILSDDEVQELSQTGTTIYKSHQTLILLYGDEKS